MPIIDADAFKQRLCVQLKFSTVRRSLLEYHETYDEEKETLKMF